MTKIKTSKLTGPALDWAVAKCEGVTVEYIDDGITRVLLLRFGDLYSPSTDWVQGGQIIEQAGIAISQYDDHPNWSAIMYETDDNEHTAATGPAPLIAAMRCYVESKLGDEVDVPKELA